MLNIQERVAATIQNPPADTKILFNDAADGLLKTKDSSGVVEELSVGLTGVPTGGTTGQLLAKNSNTDGDVEWVDEIDPDGGVLEYVALLNQTGTDAPVATVLKNTLGGVPVWTYEGLGQYAGTLIGSFILNKTTVSVGSATDGVHNTTYSSARVQSIDMVVINTATSITSVDDQLLNTYIKIEVYP